VEEKPGKGDADSKRTADPATNKRETPRPNDARPPAAEPRWTLRNESFT
jgi:hypothetical protein